jgi:hypothetical protein
VPRCGWYSFQFPCRIARGEFGRDTFQNRSFARGRSFPRHTSETSSPSNFAGSTVTPATEQSVGSQSTPATTDLSSTRPSGTRPGQRTMNGSRTPPSCRLNFRSRSGPEKPS